MAMVSVELKDSFLKQIDELIKKTGKYSSRSEFLKESMRKNLDAQLESAKKFNDFILETERLRAIAKKRGNKGGLLSKEDGEIMAKEYIKKKNKPISS